MELVKAGADRQVMHETIRGHSMAAWEALQQDPAATNPLLGLLCTDPTVLAFLPERRIADLLDASDYVGDAPHRAEALAAQIRATIKQAAGP
jgi:adenylosuccinate lyase